MNDPHTLHRLQDELRSVAKELTEPAQRAIIRDDRSVTRHELPSLLNQLRDAVSTGNESGRGGGKRGTPIPIDPAAADMLAEIEVDSVQLHLTALATEFATEDRIKAIVAVAGRWTDPAQVAVALRYLRKWNTDIRNLLDPPRRWTLTAPCPACDTRMVWRQVDGEDVQVPALTIDGTTGCSCLACGHNWPPANLELLAGALGCPPVREEPIEQEAS